MFLFPLLLKGDSEFVSVKLNVKLDENNIIKIKSMGEDEIFSGIFYGKTENLEDENFNNTKLISGEKKYDLTLEIIGVADVVILPL